MNTETALRDALAACANVIPHAIHVLEKGGWDGLTAGLDAANMQALAALRLADAPVQPGRVAVPLPYFPDFDLDEPMEYTQLRDEYMALCLFLRSNYRPDITIPTGTRQASGATTRADLRRIINEAHELLHAGKAEDAHELLHTAAIEVCSMTPDPEVQEAVAHFMKTADGQMPCGHTYGDLISAPGTVTKCGACVAAKIVAVGDCIFCKGTGFKRKDHAQRVKRTLDWIQGGELSSDEPTPAED